MHLSASKSYKYLIQAHCSLTGFPEWRKLKAKNGDAVTYWIYEDLLCRWRVLCEIVTDNSPAILKGVESLTKLYGIRHIQISGYNSHANGIVECLHFDIQQVLFKATDRD